MRKMAYLTEAQIARLSARPTFGELSKEGWTMGRLALQRDYTSRVGYDADKQRVCIAYFAGGHRVQAYINQPNWGSSRYSWRVYLNPPKEG